MLVDTGEDITAAKYVPHLLRAMSEAGCKRISKILLTHGHGDHQGGVAALTAVLQAKGSQPTPSIHKRTWLVNGRAGEDFPARGFRCVDILDGEEFACEGATLRAIYTPGHTNDHVAFWLLEDGALLTGDCILGCGTTVFDDLSTYMSSLHRLKEVVEKSNIDTQAPPITRIYPGQ
jgi:glyoxylase-like metal-dependent hydrolase (beta-lactamase superfamily II)